MRGGEGALGGMGEGGTRRGVRGGEGALGGMGEGGTRRGA